MSIVDLEEQDADQLLSVVDYLRRKVKEEEEEGIEDSPVPLLRGLLKYLVEDRLGESYEDINPAALIAYGDDSVADSTTDSLLDEFDF